MNVKTTYGAIHRINIGVDRVIRIFLILSFSVMVLASAAQILFRFALNLPLDWTEELAKYMFVWSTMLACAMYTRGRQHSAVDILQHYLPDRPRRALQFAADVLCIVFYLIFIFGGCVLTVITMNRLTPATQIPMGLMYLSVPVSGVFMIMMTIDNILHDLQEGHGK